MKPSLYSTLQDIVSHTHSLGFITVIKISDTTEGTKIESVTDDKTVVLYARTNEPVDEFTGVFGMSNLDKINLYLKNPEYKENAKITITADDENGVSTPKYLHFENETGDFVNDYRFVSTGVINSKLGEIGLNPVKWDIEFEPTVSSIQRLKLQAAVHSEESIFQTKVENGDLMLVFGSAASHAGKFVFQPNVTGKLTHTWSWPIAEVISILSASGNFLVSISNAGLLKISVDSGIAVYDYLIPAQTK